MNKQLDLFNEIPEHSLEKKYTVIYWANKFNKQGNYITKTNGKYQIQKWKESTPRTFREAAKLKYTLDVLLNVYKSKIREV